MVIVAAAVILVALCAALGLVAVRTAGAGAQVVMLMFRSPTDLGWPPGVQEDDDLHWSWSGLPASPSEVVEIVELAAGSGPSGKPVVRR